MATTTHLEHENVVLVQRGFDAFARGDMVALTEMFHARANWHLAPCGVIAGTYKGRDEIFAFFGQLAKETNGTFRSVPSHIAAEQNRVFAECTLTGTRHGKSVELRSVLVFTVDDGLVRNVDDYALDYRKAEKFWS